MIYCKYNYSYYKYLKPINCVPKKLVQARLKMLSTKYLQIIFYMYKEDLALNSG